MAARDRGVIDLTADCDTLDSARVPSENRRQPGELTRRHGLHPLRDRRRGREAELLADEGGRELANEAARLICALVF